MKAPSDAHVIPSGISICMSLFFPSQYIQVNQTMQILTVENHSQFCPDDYHKVFICTALLCCVSCEVYGFIH